MNIENRAKAWIRLITILVTILGPNFPILIHPNINAFVGVAAFQPFEAAQGLDDSGYILSQNIPYKDPFYITIDSKGAIYVTERDNNQVRKINSTGTYLICGPGSDTQVNLPDGIDIDVYDNIYVADAGNNRIIKLNSEGKLLGEFKGTTQSGSFSRPMGVTVDTAGNVYVVDSRHKLIKKFDSGGNFILSWGSGLGSPEGITVDDSGHVYVGDEDENKVYTFDSTGQPLGLLASTGSSSGLVDDPEDVTVDSHGNVYVADSGNNRIQKFDKEGNPLTMWVTTGASPENLNHPRGVVVDKDGNVYVADTENDRILKFSPIESLTGNLIIKVLDSSNQNPIQGVRVNGTTSATSSVGATSIDSTTNSTGYVFFTFLELGNWKIDLAITGYDESRLTTTLTSGLNERNIELQLETTHSYGSVIVTLTLSDGTVVPGVLVKSTLVPDQQDNLEDTTNSLGQVEFPNLLPGNYILEASKANYVTVSSDIFRVEANIRKEIKLVTEARTSNPVLDHFLFDTISNPQNNGTAFNIKITAVDQRGSILDGFNENCELIVSSGTIIPSVTGIFVRGTWSGSVTIATAVHVINLMAKKGSVTGISNDITISPAPGKLRVIVKSNEGNLGSAQVSSDIQPTGESRLYKEADSQGVSEFVNIFPGQYKISASKADYFANSKDVIVASSGWTEITITLDKMPADEGGDPITQFINRLFKLASGDGCIIATATYGGPYAPEVVFMRHVRDDLIGSNEAGRILVEGWNFFYYSWSPPVAYAISGSAQLRSLFTMLLMPLLGLMHVIAFEYNCLAMLNPQLASVVGFLSAAILATLIYIILPLWALRKMMRRVR